MEQNKVGKGNIGMVAGRTGRVYEYHQKYDLILFSKYVLTWLFKECIF